MELEFMDTENSLLLPEAWGGEWVEWMKVVKSLGDIMYRMLTIVNHIVYLEVTKRFKLLTTPLCGMDVNSLW